MCFFRLCMYISTMCPWQGYTYPFFLLFFFFGSVFSSHYARFCGQLFMAERTQSPVITTFLHLLDMLVPAPSVVFVYCFATVVAAPPRATPSVAAPPKSCTDFSTPCTETMKNLCGKRRVHQKCGTVVIFHKVIVRSIWKFCTAMLEERRVHFHSVLLPNVDSRCHFWPA